MFKLRSVIVCDDVRREESRKEFFIGVYAGGIRFLGKSPGKLRQICFRLEFEYVEKELEEMLSFELIAPSGTHVINVQSHPIKMAAKGRGVVVLTQLDLILYEAGQYRIRVSARDTVAEDTIDVSFQDSSMPGETATAL